MNTLNGTGIRPYTSNAYTDAHLYAATPAVTKTASDLTITSSSSVNLTMTAETPAPTAAVTYTSSSTGDLTWTSSNSSVATVSNGTITAVGAGTATITVSQAEDETYAASDEKSITVTVTDQTRVASDLALTAAPVALTFDLYNNKAAQVINYTTSGTGTVSVSASEYVTAVVDADAKTITVTPVKVTAEAVTITVTQAQDNTHAAGEASFTVKVDDSTPYVQPTSVKISMNYEWLGSESGKNLDASKLPLTKEHSDNVTTTITDGTNNRPRGDADLIRLYVGSTIKFTAPEGYNIVAVKFEKGSTWNKPTPDTGAMSESDNTQWAGEASSVTFTIPQGNCFMKSATITLAKQKAASDLAKKGDIELDFKGDNLMGDIADYIQTSSTGAYTYSGYDEDIILVDNDGTFMGLATGTTTITVAQAADDNYKAGSVTINVTVQDTRVAATTIPAINITSVTENEEGTISVVNPEKADAGVTFTFVSDDADVLYIDGTDYLAVEAGTAHVTVTATASDSKLYKNAEAIFEVTVNAAVKKENTIVAVFDSNSTTYGTALEGLVSGSTGFDGVITAVSSNEKVATVSVDAEGNVTVTPVAVGTTTITFSAAETGKFLAATDVQETITVTAPEGKTEALAGSEEEVVFSETFAESTGTNNDFGSSTTSDGNGTFKADSGNTWDNANASGANGSAKYGSGKNAGSGTTPSITVVSGNSYVLTFNAAPWASESTTMTVAVTGGTINGETSVTTSEMAKKQWNEYEYTIVATSTSMTIKFSASKNRFFLDEVKVIKPASSPTETVTLNAAGYATYCSENPIDFSVASDDYSAWQVTEIASDGTITLDRINTAVKGGVGVLLYGAPASNVTLTLGDATEDLQGNLLHGTLAPTYFEKDAIYGLSGSDFKHNNAGTLRANRAYLLDSDVVLDAGVKGFRIVFNDTTTGITSTREATAEEVQAIFDLSGRRLQKMQKGINIVGGKKVMVK